jgi:signal transduction histidine kinase
MATSHPPDSQPVRVCVGECVRANGQYDAVLARLDELRQDLDQAHRNECIAAERVRIAQDLHDRAAQTLFGLGLTADWLLAHVDEGEPLRPDLERLKHLAGSALAQVREAIFSLSSPPVEPAQLPHAVRSLLKDLEKAGIVGTLQVWGDVQTLSPQVTDGLYQIIREALINVRRHSKGTSVLVSLRIGPDTVTAVVQDDGQGIAPEVLDTYRKNGSHWGLRGMESRSERLGGKLQLAPGDEAGLIVTTSIPLRGAT